MPKLTDEMTVVEATLASGTLAESPANGGPSGRKWRVRVFEYGLSKNRYPYFSNGSPSANRQELPATALPLLWTERSARGVKAPGRRALFRRPRFGGQWQRPQRARPGGLLFGRAARPSRAGGHSHVARKRGLGAQ